METMGTPSEEDGAGMLARVCSLGRLVELLDARTSYQRSNSKLSHGEWELNVCLRSGR